MVGRRRTPAVLRLGPQERLAQKPAARFDGVEKCRHPAAIQVQERHYNIELTRGQMVCGKVGLYPRDREFALLGLTAADVEARRVGIDRNNGCPEGRRGNRVSPLATSQFQNMNARAEQLLVA